MEQISSATNTVSDVDSESIEKNLFKMAMERRWEEVVKECGKDKRVHKARITRSGDTVLHIAVSDCQEKYVEELVKLVSKEDLEIQNERGNTPLQLAVSMGNVRMCDCMAKKDRSLVGIRNKDKETPLFLAALHGRKDVFLCLHYICNPNESDRTSYSYCRRGDGDTILHCAITGDYFDLAFQIIVLYEDLVNYINDNGFTPLHLLASKPSAFKSGSHLTSWKMIIYHCIYVDELKVDKRVTNSSTKEREVHQEYPENYKTCIKIMRVFRNIAEVVSGTPQSLRRLSQQKSEDEENPPKDSLPGGNPGHYNTCFDFVKLLSKAMLIVLGLGHKGIHKIRAKKEKHKWAVQIMDELLHRAVIYEYTYMYDDSGMNPHRDDEIEGQPMTPPPSITDLPHGLLPPKGTQKETSEMAKNETPILITAKNGEMEKIRALFSAAELFSAAIHDLNAEKKKMAKKETPILIAAKNGVTEMVEKILNHFPVAIHDLDAEKKNIVLLAVENRQPDVYQLLLDRVIMKESVFCQLDNDGNSALHLAAKCGDYKPWLITGAAFQMQWEIKWYKFVRESMPLHFFFRCNKKDETAKEIFTSSHTDMVKDGVQWLNNTSQSCSVVAALIATVAFATASTVPGGTKEKNGKPNLENQPAFDVFAIASLVALCLSVTSMVMFLAILTSRYQEMDFGKGLPKKLFFGLTSLFLSIAAMLVSFCAGHFFVLKDTLKNAAFLVYAITCLPVTFFAIAQFPLYIDLVWATFKKVPQRRYKE